MYLLHVLTALAKISFISICPRRATGHFCMTISCAYGLPLQLSIFPTWVFMDDEICFFNSPFLLPSFSMLWKGFLFLFQVQFLYYNTMNIFSSVRLLIIHTFMGEITAQMQTLLCATDQHTCVWETDW
jgi:hypothetical protein